MKRGWRILLIAVGCGIVAGIAMALWPREGEPEYGGKKLSEWITLGFRGHVSESGPLEARDAVQHMGTNAIPYLVKWIGYEVPWWKVRLLAGMRSLPPFLRNEAVARWLAGSRERTRQNDALYAFAMLGWRGRPAIPALCRLATNGTSMTASAGALRALMSLDGEGAGVRVLLEVLGNERAPRHARVIAASMLPIWKISSIDAGAESVLSGCLASKDVRVRIAAATAMGTMVLKPGAAVNTLERCLDDRSPDVRVGSALGLGQFGADAKVAVPALTRTLADPVGAVREAATNALVMIAPEALAKSGGR